MTKLNYNTLNVNVDEDGVAAVTLNRPKKKNAMSAAMIAELSDIASTLGVSDKIRAIVLSGAGDMFCAGGDLEWMKAQASASREERMREARKLAEMLYALNEMPTPLIGKIHGSAFGGGLGLACVCDIAVASEDTKFGLPEVKLGLIPATIGPYVIARLGEGKARSIFMSGKIFGCREALALGLISQHTEGASLDKEVAMQVNPFLSAAPGAVGAAKALARALGPRIDKHVIDDSIRRLADAWESEEAAEGIDAFLSKRSPRWARQNH